MRARICDNKKRNNKSHKQKNFTRWVTSRVRGSGQKKTGKKELVYTTKWGKGEICRQTRSKIRHEPAYILVFTLLKATADC